MFPNGRMIKTEPGMPAGLRVAVPGEFLRLPARIHIPGVREGPLHPVRRVLEHHLKQHMQAEFLTDTDNLLQLLKVERLRRKMTRIPLHKQLDRIEPQVLPDILEMESVQMPRRVRRPIILGAIDKEIVHSARPL